MVGTAIGVGASLIGGAISSNAAGDAADQQKAAADAATAEQRRQYDQTRADLAPYRATGGAANAQLAYLLGLNPSSAATPTGALRPRPQGVGTTQSGTPPAATAPSVAQPANSNATITSVIPTKTGVIYKLSDGRNITSSDHGATMPVGSPYYGPNASATSTGPVSTMLTPATGGSVGILPGETPSAPTSIFGSTAPGAQPTDAYAEQYPGVNTSLGASGSLSKAFGMSDFTADPGYQFRISEGQKALERSAAAKGGLNSGAAMKAITRFGQNTASDEYQNAYNRYNTNQTNLYNRLAGVAGTGQTATNTLSGIGQSTANNISENYLQSGNAQAAGTVGQANAWGTGLSNAASGIGKIFSGGNSYDPAAAANGLPWSDERLKENIVAAGFENTFPVYEFSYVNDSRRFIGVMAQEIQKVAPYAVHEREGFLCVNYDAIGVEFREVNHAP